MPKKLVRPHAEVVDEAKQIFLAEVVGSQSVHRVVQAFEPVIYRLKIIRTFRGNVNDTTYLYGDAYLKDIWDTTFENHTEAWFWNNGGRMGVDGDCTLATPAFLIGKHYLLLLGGLEDTKQFERIDTDDDQWLRYVAKRTGQAK
jgi:hypothetical protein